MKRSCFILKKNTDLVDFSNLHPYKEPHLLTGDARIEEIARILAIGTIRAYNRQQTLIQSGSRAIQLSQIGDNVGNNAEKCPKYLTIPSVTGLRGTSERTCSCV